MKVLSLEFCVGTACHMKGSPEVVAAIDSLPPETRSHISVRMAHCLGNCAAGPNVNINGVLHSRVTPDMLLEFVRQHFSKA